MTFFFIVDAEVLCYEHKYSIENTKAVVSVNNAYFIELQVIGMIKYQTIKQSFTLNILLPTLFSP